MLQSFEQLGLAWFRLIKSHISLFFLEAKLAKASVIPLILTIFCFIVVLMGSWLVTLALGIYGFYHFTGNMFVSIFMVLIINLLILVILTALIYKWYKQLTFHNTRAHFKNYKGRLTHAKTNIKTTD